MCFCVQLHEMYSCAPWSAQPKSCCFDFLSTSCFSSGPPSNDCYLETHLSRVSLAFGVNPFFNKHIFAHSLPLPFPIPLLSNTHTCRLISIQIFSYTVYSWRVACAKIVPSLSYTSTCPVMHPRLSAHLICMWWPDIRISTASVVRWVFHYYLYVHLGESAYVCFDMFGFSECQWSVGTWQLHAGTLTLPTICDHRS